MKPRSAARLCFLIVATLMVTAASPLTLLAQEHDWLVQALSFEGTHDGDRPFGWGGGPPETISLDEENPHGGRWAARIARDAESPGPFTALTLNLPVDFQGQRVELRGFLRTHEVEGAAGLWLRQDGASGPVQFENMADHPLTGTREWAEHTITLPLDPGARKIFFGALLSGSGTVWVDDLSLLVDGKPVWEAPRAEPEKTVLDTDTAFDRGSAVRIDTLSEVQIESLALLAQVWGFVKYHHPRVAGGELHWDYELFRAMPSVLTARTPAERNQALFAWLQERVGEAPPCAPCASTPQGSHLSPRINWISDAENLGEELSGYLARTHERRFTGEEQFFVLKQEGAGNPIFEHELAYPEAPHPDDGYRLLALFRLWNIIEYWFPYRDLIEEDWNAVLRERIPRLIAARDAENYRLELMQLMALLNDTHANLWGELALRPPTGGCRLPVEVRFIEGKAVVTALTQEAAASDPTRALTDCLEISRVEIGDVLTRLGGEPVAELIAAWSPYYAASNEPTRRRDLARQLTRGPCGGVAITIDRRGAVLQTAMERLPTEGLDFGSARAHDRPGDPFQLLSPEVAYLKLSSVKIAEVKGYVERARGTRGWVIDIRNYPSEFVVFELGRRLVREPTPFARFTTGDLANPGAFVWGEPVMLTPTEPSYSGQVIVLLDEVSQSQAEYTAMAFRAGPKTTIVGSTTAGADGNVSPFPLPGGVSGLITGIGVFYPDQRPTQRVGILPDVRIAPTLAGIRGGRDEVLEAALRLILGDSADEDKIRALAALSDP